MKVYVKEHKNFPGTVLAVCDEELLGKKITGKGHELLVSEHFYKGELIEVEDLKYYLESHANVNVIGKNAVEYLLKIKVIEDENITLIGDVPHVIIIKV